MIKHCEEEYFKGLAMKNSGNPFLRGFLYKAAENLKTSSLQGVLTGPHTLSI